MNVNPWRVLRMAGLALVPGLAIFMAILFLREARAGHRNFEDKANYAASQYAGEANVRAKSSCGLLSGVEKLDCSERIYRRAREQSRQEYELAAQRQNALWNAAMGEAAMIGGALSVFTLLLVFFTYAEQREANEIAGRQHEQSRRDAEANLAHARRVSQLELRPYVFVDKIEREQLAERYFQLVVWLKNFGRTPARNLEAIVTTYVARDLSKLRKHRPRADRIELGTAGPDSSRRAFSPLIFTEAQWEAPAFDRAYGIIRVKYTYTDDTGETRFEESFDYYTDPTAIMKDEPMFYLLTPTMLEKRKRWEARQGDLLTYMRRKTRAQAAHRRRTEEGEEEKA